MIAASNTGGVEVLAQSFSRLTQATLRLFHLVNQDRNRGDRGRPAGQLLVNGTPIALETQEDRATVFVGRFRLLSVCGDEPLQALERVLPFVHVQQCAVSAHAAEVDIAS